MLHWDFTSYKKRNIYILLQINFVMYKFFYISIFLRSHKLHTTPYDVHNVCLCTYLQKSTTPKRGADIKGINKQTDIKICVHIVRNWLVSLRTTCRLGFCTLYSICRHSIVLTFKPDTMSTTRFGTFSRVYLSWVDHGHQACIPNSKCDLTYCLYRLMNT
jgi:hypothetical protein